MQPAILIIDDEPTQRLMLAKLCEGMGFAVTLAGNGEEGLLHLEQPGGEAFALVLTDLRMPVVDGREVVRRTRERYPEMPVIVITAEQAEPVAEELKALGAQDFLTKPIGKDRLQVSIDNALQLRALKQELTRLKRREDGSFSFDTLIGATGGLTESVATARKYARTDMPVLITGESGTGKEVFARAIHGESNRFGKPFIAINCGAIPVNLVESTLFGHEKGAFTGAVEKSLGKFREAQGGTLFLDEIGELPPDSQVRLLRALQEGEVEPVGLGRPVRVDVRIIAATNRDLPEQVNAKRFREDLFYRLNVLPLALPPLRERRGDLAALCDFFLQRICATQRLTPRRLDGEAQRWMLAYDWPGNVRELENTLARACLLSEGPVLSRAELETLAQTQPEIAAPPTQQEAGGRLKTLEEITLEAVVARLHHFDGNTQETARSLGMPASTFYRKLRAWKKAGKLD